MSSSFLLSLLVVLLALTHTNAARPSLATFLNPVAVAPSFPVEVAAPLAGPSIGAIWGVDACYDEVANQVQCLVGGGRVGLFVNGLSDTATVSVGSTYTCSVTSVNASESNVFCTLPSSIAPSDYNKSFSVTVTTGGQTSAPFTGVTFLQRSAMPFIISITGCYSWVRNQLQCPVGAPLQLFVNGLADTATVTVGSDYNCAVTAVDVATSSLNCTLPTSIAPSDFNVYLPVTVTTGGQTSAPVSGVTFPKQATPTITAIIGCEGGSGTTATACRQDQTIQIVGTGLSSGTYKIMIGSYACYQPLYYQNQVVCYVPAIAEADLNTALPVTLSLNGLTATYAPGLISYGELAITSVTGCGVTSGPVKGCGAGDVLTITGAAFNLGQPGDANNLRFSVYGAESTPAFTVLSDSVIHLTLPSPTYSDFSLTFQLFAGTNALLSAKTPYSVIYYAPVLLVTRTFGGIKGCDYSQQVNAPLCQVGDVLQAWMIGAAPSAVQSVNILSPSTGHSYNCGSVGVNDTVVYCIVPAVSSSDLNEVLGVSITVGGLTSKVLPSGLYIPLA